MGYKLYRLKMKQTWVPMVYTYYNLRVPKGGVFKGGGVTGEP